MFVWAGRAFRASRVVKILSFVKNITLNHKLLFLVTIALFDSDCMVFFVRTNSLVNLKLGYVMKNFIAICALSFALAACMGGGGGGDGASADGSSGGGSSGGGSTPSTPGTPSDVQGIGSPGSVSVVPPQD